MFIVAKFIGPQTRAFALRGLAHLLIISLGVGMASQNPAESCVWTSYTMEEELSVSSSLVDTLMGTVPEHGSAFYAAEVRRLQYASGVTDLNDLAVAYLKLGRIDDAEAAFAKIEAVEPGRYETLSNVGIMRKKQGRFGDAQRQISAALDLRPEGHPGVGPLYLNLLAWRETEARAKPMTTFLGDDYSDPFPRRRLWSRLGAIVSLLRADPHFSDAYLVLGDELRFRDMHGLAMYAYEHARRLGHPRPDVIEARIARVHHTMRQAAFYHPERLLSVPSLKDLSAGIQADFENADDWRRRLNKVEAELAEGEPRISLEQVEAELVRRGFHRPRPPMDRGVTESWAALLSNPLRAVYVGLPLLLASIVLLALRTARRRRQRAIQQPT